MVIVQKDSAEYRYTNSIGPQDEYAALNQEGNVNEKKIVPEEGNLPTSTRCKSVRERVASKKGGLVKTVSSNQEPRRQGPFKAASLPSRVVRRRATPPAPEDVHSCQDPACAARSGFNSFVRVTRHKVSASVTPSSTNANSIEKAKARRADFFAFTPQ